MSARNYYLLKKYGITEVQYDDLLRKQHECCAVCKRHHTSFPIRLAVDHDHKTGEVRGLLCKYCNRYGVGRHRRENGASLLLAAAEYLLRPEYTGWIAPPRIKKKRKKKRVRK
jgi:hypothetical protein